MPGETTQEPTSAFGELVVDYSAFAVAAGLAPDAGRTDIVSAIGAAVTAAKAQAGERKDIEASASKANADLAKVLAATGTKTADEACGVIAAWKSDAEDGKEAVAELATVKAASEKAEAASLIEAAVKDGRIVPAANREKVEALYGKFGIAGLKAHLDALSPHPALSGAKVTQRGDEAEASVTLSAEDEKMIASSGIKREDFIAARKAELAEARKRQG